MHSAWFDSVRCKLCRDRGVYARWSIMLPDADFIEPDEHEAEVVERQDVTPDGAPYWAPGEPIRYRNEIVATHYEDGTVEACEQLSAREREALEARPILDGAPGKPQRRRAIERWVEEAPCSCTAVASDYDERKQARADRREAKAADLREQAARDRQRSLDLLPDFGQPVLVGHHSEQRHRNALKKSAKLMSRSCADLREAVRLEQMANGARGTSEISSDDPHAPAKLRARAWWLDWQHEKWKATRKAARKAARKRGEKVERDGGHDSANIRRLRKRADEIEKARARTLPDDVRVGDFLLTWDADENRVQIYSPRPSTPEQREKQTETMRRAGFRWARSNGCWQRQASMQAWHLGKAAIERLAGVHIESSSVEVSSRASARGTTAITVAVADTGPVLAVEVSDGRRFFSERALLACKDQS